MDSLDKFREIDEMLGFDPENGEKLSAMDGDKYEESKSIKSDSSSEQGDMKLVLPIQGKAKYAKLMTVHKSDTKDEKEKYLRAQNGIKAFMDNPNDQNLQKLKSLNIGEIASAYKIANTKQKQKLETRLYMCRKDQEVNNILKSISEFSISRFNSPVVKMSSEIDSQKRHTGHDNPDEGVEPQGSFSSQFGHQSSINTFIQNIVSKSDEMEVIKEENEQDNANITTPAGSNNNKQFFKNMTSLGSSIQEGEGDTSGRHPLAMVAPAKNRLSLPTKKQTAVFMNKESLDRFLDNVKDRYNDFKQNIPQGQLIRWLQGKKLGDAQYGDIINAMNLKNGKIFAIKRLNLFKTDKE